ncbi:MAG: TIGR00269 family protein [Thermoplasmata archaeon]|nr:TIGR00269 family protein [Thermoplasmata archaeon]
MVKKCSKCNKPSITFIRYNGTHLCKEHFIEYFEKRVKKEIKKQGKTESGSRIGVALSGGKDSTVTLFMLKKIFSKRKDVDLFAISVDEGIKDYRDKSLKIARENCKEIEVEHHIISFKETIGYTLDEIVSKSKDLGECTYCGVFRRFCLNKKARELELNKIATGHNLDDFSQSILMNFVNGDLEKLARLGPHIKVQPGLIPRILPLRVIPEKEVTLYAIINNIKFYDGICPYSIHALRGKFRDILDELEYINPGTRHSIVKSYDGIKDILIQKFPPAKLNKCKICGEPTSQEICKACELLRSLK